MTINTIYCRIRISQNPHARITRMRLGFVGFGEAGFHLAKGLRTAGLETISAFDIHTHTPGHGELIRQRAADAEVAAPVQGAAPALDRSGLAVEAGHVLDRGFVTYSNAAKETMLGVPAASPVLRCERITTDTHGRAVLMSEHVFPARRTKDILVLLSVVAVALLYLLFRLMRPERLADGAAIGRPAARSRCSRVNAGCVAASAIPSCS